MGLRVLRRAAAERAREEAAAKERRLVSMQLQHAGDGAQSSRPEPRKGQFCAIPRLGVCVWPNMTSRFGTIATFMVTAAVIGPECQALMQRC